MVFLENVLHKLGLSITFYNLLNLNVFSHIDYTYEDEAEMSIEIITNDFDEGTIPQMAIDSGINTGKLIGYLQKID